MTRNRRVRTGSGSRWLVPALALLLAGCGGGGKGRSTLPDLERSIRDEGTPWAERVEHARRAAVLAPWEPYWPYAVGSLYVEADSLPRAESVLLQALDVDPAYGPALSLLSEVYYREARHEEAVALLESARAAHPDGPSELLADLVLHQEALGHREAVQNLMQGLKGTPEDASVRTFVLLRGDDFSAAAEPAGREVAASPGSAVHQNNYGITRLHAGDPAGAKEAFLTAVSLDPYLPGPLYNLALVERFYFMNETAGRQWFDRYRELSRADPDGLAQVFYPAPEPGPAAAPDSTTASEEGRKP